MVFGGEEHGKVFWKPFCIGCQRAAYQGNTKLLWEALDPNENGFVELITLDPTAHDDLSEFAQALLGTYGTPEDAWRWCFNLCRSHRVMYPAFEAISDELGFAGFNEKRRRNLFKCLDADADGCITEKDLQFLVHFKDDQPPMSARSPRTNVKSIKGKGRGTLSAQKRAQALGPAGAAGLGKSGKENFGGFQALSPDGAPFVFEVVVNRDEYREYLERKRRQEAQQRQATTRRVSVGEKRVSVDEIKTTIHDKHGGKDSSDDEDGGMSNQNGAWDLSSVYSMLPNPISKGELTQQDTDAVQYPLSEFLHFTWDDHKPSGAAPKATLSAQASAIGAMRANQGNAGPGSPSPAADKRGSPSLSGSRSLRSTGASSPSSVFQQRASVFQY